MSTEAVDPRFVDLDAWPLTAAMEAMWDGQLEAIAAVRTALPQITAATVAAAIRLRSVGRLIYVGAGTSGRVAVQDGAELGPTFSWPLDRVVFVMAGGNGALLKSVENAEDDAGDGAGQMDLAGVTKDDVVIGLTASGGTPFTVAAIERARALGALTIGIANNAATPILHVADFPVLIDTGSEVLAGSTRMKAGTAQKVVLNLISTGIMLAQGRVYKGLMVNMQTSNAKLRKRAVRMVMQLAHCDEQTATDALAASGDEVKMAVMIAMGHRQPDAAEALAKSGGNLRKALEMCAVPK
ncbi:MAG: N-acetylmuramic acid 6-phosphate etherase [Rhizobiaceae bacterium]